MTTRTQPVDARRALYALPSGSVVLLVGAKDTGKTTFAHEVARASLQPLGLVDADIGQTELGIPGVVAATVVNAQVEQGPVRTWPVCAAEFVGGTSPPSCLLDWIPAIVVCVRSAFANGAERVLIDMPGWVTGALALLAYRSLMQIVPPDLVLTFERENDPIWLLSLFDHRSAPPIVARIAVPENVGRKTPETRKARRCTRLGAYFSASSTHVVKWSDVALIGCNLYRGPALPPHVLKFIGATLRARCEFACLMPGGTLHVVVDSGGAGSHQISPLLEHFHAKSVIIVLAESYTSLLCGLYDAGGRFLDAALIESIDFAVKTLAIRTPLARSGVIAQIAFGTLRARIDGKEIGELRVK